MFLNFFFLIESNLYNLSIDRLIVLCFDKSKFRQTRGRQTIKILTIDIAAVC